MRTFLWLLAALFLTSDAYADEKTPLFRDYYYGMSRSLIASGNASPCAEVLGELAGGPKDALCGRDQIKYLNQNWHEMFVFDGDKLSQVDLLKKFDSGSYMAMIVDMINNKFMPVIMTQGEKSLDVVSTMKEQGQKRASKVISDFEQKALAGVSGYTVIFLPLDFIRNNNSKGAFELLGSDQADLRCITITKSGDSLVLAFETLGQTIKNFQNIKDSKESF